MHLLPYQLGSNLSPLGNELQKQREEHCGPFLVDGQARPGQSITRHHNDIVSKILIEEQQLGDNQRSMKPTTCSYPQHQVSKHYTQPGQLQANVNNVNFGLEPQCLHDLSQVKALLSPQMEWVQPHVQDQTTTLPMTLVRAQDCSLIQCSVDNCFNHAEDQTMPQPSLVNAQDSSCILCFVDNCSSDQRVQAPHIDNTSHAPQASDRTLEYQDLSFSPEAVQKQSDIISFIWPKVTPTAKQEAPEFCKLYDAILAKAAPNCLGARIELQTPFNIEKWEQRLVNYHDREICTFFKYGWPMGYHNSFPPVSVEDNHTSARAHQRDVDAFIKTELAHGALVGPFSTPPFAPWTRCSPVGDKYYLDRCPAFGCKTSSAACQRMSNSLVYMMREAGHFLLAYLDDSISCHKDLVQATASYEYFINLAQELGLQLASHKCVKPSTRIEWLGYTVDTKLMTIAVPHAKLQEIIQECQKWKDRRRASKKMVQSIAGRLMYISNCIKPATLFITRILSTLRDGREWTVVNGQPLMLVSKLIWHGSTTTLQ